MAMRSQSRLPVALLGLAALVALANLKHASEANSFVPSARVTKKQAVASRPGMLPQGQGSAGPDAKTAAAVLLLTSMLKPEEAAQAADSASFDPANPLGLGVLAAALLAAVVGVVLTSGDGGKVDDKAVVKDYFNNEGFQRWNKIYGETEDINPVQKDIRIGHAQTVDTILGWLDQEVDGKKVCDAGCGTGSLSIPLAQKGAEVSASDISKAMVSEAARRAEVVLDGATGKTMPRFEASDLEDLKGEYDCVCCVDVLIHYPPEKMDAMVSKLASLSKDRVILSFAPKTWYYVLLKRIGELFPGPAKTTRAYLHEEDLVEAALKKAGFAVERRGLTATTFYFSQILEARPLAAAKAS